MCCILNRRVTKEDIVKINSALINKANKEKDNRIYDDVDEYIPMQAREKSTNGAYVINNPSSEI